MQQSVHMNQSKKPFECKLLSVLDGAEDSWSVVERNGELDGIATKKNAVNLPHSSPFTALT